jgi:hypothetical protein
MRVIVRHQHDRMYFGDCDDHCLLLSCSALSVSRASSSLLFLLFSPFPTSFPAYSCFAASSSSVPFHFLFSTRFPLLLPLLPFCFNYFYSPSSSSCFYSFRSSSFSPSYLVFSSTSFLFLLLFLHFLSLAFLLLFFFSFTVFVLYRAIYLAT